MNLIFGKNGTHFTITDSKTGFTINIERGAAKALARFLMVELNIIKAETNEGMKVHETDMEFRRLLNLRWGNQWRKE